MELYITFLLCCGPQAGSPVSVTVSEPVRKGPGPWSGRETSAMCLKQWLPGPPFVVRAAGCLFRVEGFEFDYFGLLQVLCLQLLVPEAGGQNNPVNDLTLFRDRISGYMCLL